MKIHFRDYRSFFRRAGMLGTVLTLLWLFACQDATEPSDLEVGIIFVIDVSDQGGNDLADVTISGRPLDAELGAPFNGRTDAAGRFTLEKFQVPVGPRVLYEITASPPPTLVADVIVDTIHVFCDNTNASLTMQAVERVRCNEGGSATVRFDEICFADLDGTPFIAATPLLRPDCACDMSIVASAPNLAGLTLDVVDAAGTPFTDPLPEDGEFMLELSFLPQSIGADNDTITITGAGPCGGFTYQVFVTSLVEDCTDCDCPDLPQAILPLISDTVCVGEQETVPIPFGNLVNSGEPDCTLEFTLERDFNAQPDLRIIGGPTLVQGGGAAVPAVQVRFSPTRRGAYTDTAFYSVRKRNPGASDTEDCGSVPVVFRGFGGIPICGIGDDPADTTLVTTDSTLHNCVGHTPDQKTLWIRNDGECPLEFSAAMQNGASPLTLGSNMSGMVAPGDSVALAIEFEPLDTHVWPGGKGSAPGILEFTNQITLSGDCDTTITVAGLADTTCQDFLYYCSHEFAVRSNLNESVRINEDNTLVKENEAGSVFDIYLETITFVANGNPANALTLSSGLDASTNDELVVFEPVASGIIINTNTDICQTFPPNAPNICLDFGSGAITGNPTLPNVNVGDVIMFYKQSTGLCGLIFVQEISVDRQGADVLTQACLQVCYPFVF